MGANTKIEWTDYTFNPWWGCQMISPACTNCYAAAWAKRWGKDVWGHPDRSDREPKKGVWKEARKWNRDASREMRRRKVFAASMADVFEDHPQLPELRKRFFELVNETPWLDWQLLTKRPENIEPMMAGHFDGVPHNVWLGTTAENQEYWNERVPVLLSNPAVVHFVSAEPLLGSIQMAKGETPDWLIVGGESGPGARPMNPAWAWSLCDQASDLGVSFFFKQWGAHDDMGNRLGKKKTGRILNERTYDEFPRVRS